MLSLPQSLSPELTARLYIVAKQHRVPEPLAGKAVLLACAMKNGKLFLSVCCLNNLRHSQVVKGQVTVPEQPDCPGRKWHHYMTLDMSEVPSIPFSGPLVVPRMGQKDTRKSFYWLTFRINSNQVWWPGL